MRFVPTSLDGVTVIEPSAFEDSRGFFLEFYRRDRFAEAGLDAVFVQDNHSASRRGTLRGLHFQHPHDQVKLCRVVTGEVFDVVVDVRVGSPSFGRAFWTTLSEENRRLLWIPVGFAHGFCVLSDVAEFEYKCSDYYAPADEAGILWNDPTLEIPWPLAGPILSDKDARLPLLAECTRLPRYR